MGRLWLLGGVLLLCACHLGTAAITAVPPQPAPTKTLAGTPPPVDASSELSAPNTPRGGCAAPQGWMLYSIQRGDTLSVIARRYGTTLAALTAANCIENPDRVRAGQTIYVPPTGTATP